MNKLARIVVLYSIFAIVLSPAMVFAADADEEAAAKVAATQAGYAKNTAKASFGYLGIGLGAGLAAVGGALGIGMLSASVIMASARQPEMRGQLLTIMFIGAALIEGLALFALVICIMCMFL